MPPVRGTCDRRRRPPVACRRPPSRARAEGRTALRQRVRVPRLRGRDPGGADGLARTARCRAGASLRLLVALLVAFSLLVRALAIESGLLSLRLRLTGGAIGRLRLPAGAFR